MQKSTSPKRKNRLVLSLVGFTILALGAAFAAYTTGMSPTRAAYLAQQPDTQVAVFLIPVSLLMGALLIEAVRFMRHGPLPASVTAPKRAPKRPNWSDSTRR